MTSSDQTWKIDHGRYAGRRRYQPPGIFDVRSGSDKKVSMERLIPTGEALASAMLQSVKPACTSIFPGRLTVGQRPLEP